MKRLLCISLFLSLQLAGLLSYGQSGAIGILTSAFTHNYRWSPATSSNTVTFTNGYLTGQTSGGRRTLVCNKGVSSASLHTLVYWETTIDAAASPIGVGFVNSSFNAVPATTSLGEDVNSWSYLTTGGSSYAFHNSVTTAYGTVAVVSHIISVCLDMTNGNAFFAYDGTWQGGATAISIAAGSSVGAAFTGLTGTLYPAAGEFGGFSFKYTADFGDSAFTYSGSIPVGASAYNTNP